MTAIEITLYGGITAVGLALSALFSGMETGIYTLNRVRVAVRAGELERRALRLQRLLVRPARTLSTLLIGNNIANYLGSFGLAAILNGVGMEPGLAIAVNAGVLIPLLFIFGETLPKDLFRTHTDLWSYALSGFLVTCQRVFTWTGLAPLVEAFGHGVGRLIGGQTSVSASARQRMSRLIKEGVGTGVLTHTQITLMDRALGLRERTVGNEMIPWRAVATIRRSEDLAARKRKLRNIDFTRVPVIEADGRAASVMSVLDALIHPDAPTDELTRPCLEFEPSLGLMEALRSLRHTRQSMAIVVDPRTRRPVGIVTLKDLVEPLTGELAAW